MIQDRSSWGFHLHRYHSRPHLDSIALTSSSRAHNTPCSTSSTTGMYAPSPKASSSTPTRAQPSIKPQRRPKQQQPLTSTPSTANTASSSTTLGTGQYANREPPPHLQPTNSKSRSSAVPASTSASSYSHGNLGQVHGQAGTGPSKVVMEKWMRDAGLEDVLEDLSR
jgi:hypothetical protein